MKKLFLFFTLLATFAACSKSEDGADNNNPNNNQGGNIPSSIEVESTDWVISESGGYYYLDFYASDNWKAFLVNNSDWLSVVSGHGEAGNNKLKNESSFTSNFLCIAPAQKSAHCIPEE